MDSFFKIMREQTKEIKIKLHPVSVGKKIRRTPMNTANVPMHWAVKSAWKKAWEQEVWAGVQEHKKEFGKLPYGKASIIVYLYNVRQMDTDGAYASCKPILDGLRYAGVIIDDSPRYITFNVEQIKVNHKCDERVEIFIKTI
jgi:hypothetical protein